MARKLTEEQRAEMVRRYEAGAGMVAIGRDFGVSVTPVKEALVAAGVPRRSRQEAWAARQGRAVPIGLMSRDRLLELYWGAGSGYPSIAALARDLGCEKSGLHKVMKRHEIPTRSVSEQRRLDIRAGRYGTSRPGNPNGKRGGYDNGYVRTRKHRRLMSQVISAARRQKWPPVTLPCGWCGTPVTRPAWQAKKHPSCGCCQSHASSYVCWLRRDSTSEARPLIVARLRELLAPLMQPTRYAVAPLTREEAERIGATIGAQEAEILEVLAEGRP